MFSGNAGGIRSAGIPACYLRAAPPALRKPLRRDTCDATLVRYAGPPLALFTRYVCRLRVWDAAGTGAKAFESTVAWGDNLQSEHERFLSEEHFKCPVTVFNYPRSLKPFYMKVNAPDALGRETVRAMDLLVPGIGEIIGGSQREERLDVLLDNMARQGLREADYRWYVDLRRYGTVPHSGFGLGFERMLMFVTGVSNIRDVIPYPRTTKNAEF